MPSRARIVLAFAAIYLLWGATYLAIRVGVGSVPPLLLAAARFLLAGAIAYGWGRFRGHAAPAGGQWRSLLVLGALMFLAGYGALFWSETRVASGIAAVVVALIPMWVAALEIWVFRLAAGSWRVLAGCAAGVAGVALLAAGTLAGGLAGRPALPAILALLGASWAWSLGTVYMHRWDLPRSPWVNAGAQMGIGGALLFAASAALGQPARLRGADLGWPVVAALAYLVVAGSIVGYLAYVWLLKHVDAVKVSSYALVNPVVALLLGFLLAGERLSRVALSGCVLILAALALVLARPAARARGSAA